MDKGSRILVAEFGISMGIVLWSATKRKYWPWPPNLNRIAFAYAILGLLSVANEKFAALLGAGFLMAQVVKTPVDAEGNFKFTGGIPPGVGTDSKDFVWYYLTWGKDPETTKPVSKNFSPGTGGHRGMQPITEGDKERDGSIPIQA